MRTQNPIAQKNYSLIGKYWYSPTRPKLFAFGFVVFIALVVFIPLLIISSDDDTVSGTNKTTHNEQAQVMQQPVPADTPVPVDIPVPVPADTPVIADMSPIIDTPHKTATVTIHVSTYAVLYHPIYGGPKIFKEDSNVQGCPNGGGFSVLFGHSECQATCNFLNDCIGYNFDSTRNLCVFFTNVDCLNHLADQTEDGIVAFIKEN